jgi:hypothetical protein
LPSCSIKTNQRALFEDAQLGLEGDDLFLMDAFAFLRLLAEPPPLALVLLSQLLLALPAALEEAFPMADLLTELEPFGSVGACRTATAGPRCRWRTGACGLSRGRGHWRIGSGPWLLGQQWKCGGGGRPDDQGIAGLSIHAT